MCACSAAMPATMHVMNQLQLALAAVFTNAAVAAAIAQGYPGFDAAVRLLERGRGAERA